MPTFNNYTFSSVKFQVTEATNVAAVQPTATILISPVSGYSINASDFSLNPAYSDPAVSSVTFTQNGDNIDCLITFDSGFVMPSDNKPIALGIIGEGVINQLSISGVLNATVGSNISVGSAETNTPYSESGSPGETDVLFSRTYTADTGYYFEKRPKLSIVSNSTSNYYVVETPVFNIDNQLTSITFQVSYKYPQIFVESVSGDIININVPSAKIIYVSTAEVSGYSIDKSNLGHSSEIRTMFIYGGEGAEFSLTLDDGATTETLLSNVIMPATGSYPIDIEFPLLEVGDPDVTYTLELSGDLASPFTLDNPFTISQVSNIDITFTETNTFSLTGWTDVTASRKPLTVNPLTSIGNYNGDFIVKIDQTITKTGYYLSVLKQLEVSDFEEANDIAATITADATSSTIINIDDSTGITAGDRFKNYTDDINIDPELAPFDYEVISVDSSTQLTISPAISVSNGDELIFTKDNGTNISILNSSIENMDNATLRVKATILLNSTGDTDTTFTLNLNNIIIPSQIVTCGAAVVSGGEGITDLSVDLDSGGGLVTFLINGRSMPDKFEIIHGDAAGTKVATSSQLATGNAGPFDNVFGTYPSNLIPDTSDATSSKLFIGSLIASPPTRQTQFTAATGYTIPTMTVGAITYQQVIWWEYTADDYSNNPVATLRITGPSGGGTAWDVLRVCCPDGNCTI